jgi:hypothetical protein
MKTNFVLILFFLVSNIILSQINNGNEPINNWKEKNSKKEIFAFIGEKISIEDYKRPMPEDDYKISASGDSIKTLSYLRMDNGYKAKYKVIKNIHNEIKTDTIEFIAFDHYGTPTFSKCENALLFLFKEKEAFYHFKYQYFEVFKTDEGKWAGIYDKTKYRDTRIEPIKLNFKEDVSIELNEYLKKHRYFLFPKKYFDHIGDKVITNYGNYVDDLFTIKKEGILKARGYFK